MTVEPRSVTAFIGPSGCGKSTFLRTLNRMHEVTPGGRVEGKVMLDDENLYGPSVDPVAVRRTVGMVFQRPNPFPTMSIYDNVVAGLQAERRRARRRELDDIVEKSLQRRNLWDEVKDRLNQPGAGPVRRPAAAPVHRPRHRGRAAGAADGRALLGARPDLDAGDRGPDRRAEGRASRSSSSPTTCSRPPASRTGPAFFNLAGVGQPGRLIENDETEKIFSNPTEQATEDYISGRFG